VRVNTVETVPPMLCTSTGVKMCRFAAATPDLAPHPQRVMAALATRMVQIVGC
jgi:hypothetical protein